MYEAGANYVFSWRTETALGVVPAVCAALNGDLADFVLSPFGTAERDEVLSLMPRFVDAAELWVRDGIVAAMNTHNRQPEST